MKTMEERLDEENQKRKEELEATKEELETTQEALNFLIMSGGAPSE